MYVDDEPPEVKPKKSQKEGEEGCARRKERFEEETSREEQDVLGRERLYGCASSSFWPDLFPTLKALPLVTEDHSSYESVDEEEPEEPEKPKRS
jgi:hypothetical protein